MLHAAEFLENCTRVRDFSPRTVSTYADTIVDLERVLSIDDPGKITTRDLDHYLSRRFLAGDAPSTRRTKLYALKSFFGFLFSRGIIEADPAAAVMPPRGKRGQIPSFTEAEVERMVFGCKPSAITRGAKENDFSFARRRRIHEARFDRDSALIGLAYSGALRAEEIGRIRNEHFWTDGNGVPSLVIVGAKAAVEPTRQRVDTAIARLIDRWLARRIAHGIASEFIFCAAAPAAEGGLTSRHVWQVLHDRALLAGMSSSKRRISPHVLRYSRATHMYAATKDILVVSAFLRHKKVETTVDYIRLGSLSSRAKTATLSLPWNRKGLSDLV